MANGDAGLDPGRDVGRPDDVSADRRHEIVTSSACSNRRAKSISGESGSLSGMNNDPLAERVNPNNSFQLSIIFYRVG